jgi:hypothetical protein
VAKGVLTQVVVETVVVVLDVDVVDVLVLVVLELVEVFSHGAMSMRSEFITDRPGKG